MPEKTNHWFDERCARAFWDQRQAFPYQELLRDTGKYLDPASGETWLDLGCGGGQLSALLWNLADGTLERIIAADCAAINARAIDKVGRRLDPQPGPGQIEFRHLNLSQGLP